MAPKNFKYRDLDPERREIRLLFLEPDFDAENTGPSSSIRCELQHFSLLIDPKVPYNAVSYCWGENPSLERIIVNGEEDHIPASAVAALRSTRHPADTKEGYPVWIDAVCINQKDSAEKSHQVTMMGEIYKNASCVLIWLGDEEPSTEFAVEAMKTAFHTVSENDLESTTLARRTEAWGPDEWREIIKFFDSLWFGRLWTQEELILSTSAICYWGRHSISWHMSKYATLIVELNREDERRRFRDCDGLFAAVQATATSVYGHFYPVTFTDTQKFNRLFDASDLRDRVYAVLGLIDHGKLPPASAELLKPDYSRDVSEIYTRAASVVLQSSTRLEILSSAQDLCPIGRYRNFRDRREDLHNMPSWAPRPDMWKQWHISDIWCQGQGADADLRAIPTTNPETPRIWVYRVSMSATSFG